MEPQDLKCLLLHELNHVRRRDLWVRLCSAAALIVHWYNPLFHMLDRTVREVGEERCDEDVAQLLDRRERLRYGQMLLQMAAGNPGQTAPGPCVFLPGRPWKGGSVKCCTQRP